MGPTVIVDSHHHLFRSEPLISGEKDAPNNHFHAHYTTIMLGKEIVDMCLDTIRLRLADNCTSLQVFFSLPTSLLLIFISTLQGFHVFDLHNFVRSSCGKEIVCVCLDRIRKLVDNCTSLQVFFFLPTSLLLIFISTLQGFLQRVVVAGCCSGSLPSI